MRLMADEYNAIKNFIDVIQPVEPVGDEWHWAAIVRPLSQAFFDGLATAGRAVPKDRYTAIIDWYENEKGHKWNAVKIAMLVNLVRPHGWEREIHASSVYKVLEYQNRRPYRPTNHKAPAAPWEQANETMLDPVPPPPEPPITAEVIPPAPPAPENIPYTPPEVPALTLEHRMRMLEHAMVAEIAKGEALAADIKQLQEKFNKLMNLRVVA